MNSRSTSRLRRISHPALVAAILVTLLLSGISVSAAPPPGPLTVNTSADDNIFNHNCTLREAIIAANTNSIVDQCAAGGVTDQIIFTVGTVNISAPLPAIIANSFVTIDGGSAQPVTLHATFQSGDLFTVNAAGHLTLSNLNYHGGSGSCVRSAGVLVLFSSTFSSCQLTGTAGQIAIVSSIGGPIDTHTAAVTLIVTDSAFAGSCCGIGYTFWLGNGPATIIRSTFGSAMHASIVGGNPLNINRSLFQTGTGNGTTAIVSKTLILTNSIISGVGLAVEVDGQGTITNSTIVGNQAGIGTGGLGSISINIRNTILNNASHDCWQVPLSTFINDGNNTQHVGDCGNIPILVDPKLDTQFIPLPGSPVIDAGLSSWCPQDDYFGTLRPLDGNGDGGAVCDIGAVEYKP